MICLGYDSYEQRACEKANPGHIESTCRINHNKAIAYSPQWRHQDEYPLSLAPLLSYQYLHN